MKSIRFLLPLVAVCMILASCSEDSNQMQTEMGELKIRMTDAPANLDAAVLTFSEISIQSEDGTWRTVRGNPVTLDLMQWRNGKTVVIVDTELAAGTYSNIRLMLTNAEITVSGKTHTLDLSSAAQTDLTLEHSFDINPDATCNLLIDFDAAQSIVVVGSGNAAEDYMLKPMLRVIPMASAGSISGDVTNSANNPIVAIKDTAGKVVATSTVDAPTGEWMCPFLAEGTYTVVITNDAGKRFTKTGVVVLAEENAYIGTIALK